MRFTLLRLFSSWFIFFGCKVGDIFDRGDDDLRIEEWIHRLALEAKSADGAIYSIMGNHEVTTPETQTDRQRDGPTARQTEPDL